jgi:malate synthase
MEDAATAEICRSQIWQWIHYGGRTREGAVISEIFDDILAEELNAVEQELGPVRFAAADFDTAAKLFSDMVKKDEFDEFLTVPAYDYLP